MNHFSGSVDPDLALQFGTVTGGRLTQQLPQTHSRVTATPPDITRTLNFKVKMYNEVKIVHNYTSQQYMEF